MPNKTIIVKNTFILYFRMILIMGVTLYTSRVVLDVLGVNDYALYNVIFGLIGILSFLNGTLSIGTSRFLTYELGANNKEKLQKTFSTALVTHVVLALLILLIGETVGLWYVNNVLVVDSNRQFAAHVVYQISILSTCISILQVPYTSAIIAHEKMSIYAYIGIFEAIAKLSVIYLLVVCSVDRLILYAFLTMLILLIVMITYIVYCSCLFSETCTIVRPNKQIFREILKFSGWNILANLSNTLSAEGVILLFNIFFQPVVVAAQGITKQISSALMSFVNNIRIAVNPQITKLYAAGDFDESKQLTIKSAELIFYLLLLLGCPCIILMPTLLNIWLVDVPDYAVPFSQLIVIQNIFDNFNASFYTPMTAANKIRKNSIAAAVMCIGQFLLLYILFKSDFGPLWARYLGLFSCVLFSYIIKPYILYKDINYTFKELYACIIQSLKVSVIIAVPSLVLYFYVPQNSFVNVVIIGILSVLIVLVTILMCMDRDTRNGIVRILRLKLKI